MKNNFDLEVKKILKNAEKFGIRGVQKELNRFKINKLLAKV